MVKKENRFLMQLTIHLLKYTDDSDKNYSLILGDFNCAIQKNLDRNPPQQLDDISVREFQSMLHRNDLFDVWRKLNPEAKRYTVLLNAVNRNQESIIFYVVTP
jgi:exonuclease III